jgi:CheY-like chemotaxis protein
MNFSTQTIMLVDDNDTDNFIHQRVVEISEFARKVLVKNSGKSALEYLSTHADQEDNLPDLIFLDINMPVISGFGFLDKFISFPSKLKKKCKILILSSSENENDYKRMAEYEDVIKFLTKPLSEESLEILKKELITLSK